MSFQRVWHDELRGEDVVVTVLRLLEPGDVCDDYYVVRDSWDCEVRFSNGTTGRMPRSELGL